MLAAKKQSIEDMLVEALAGNPYQEGPALLSLIKHIRPKTTKQAMYSALKSLVASETIAKVGGRYFLSRVWLHKISRLFQEQKEKELARDAIFDLRDGESISYRFPSLLSCDTYWAHIFNVLVEWTPERRAIFVWNPHEWYAIARRTVEVDIFREAKEKNKHIFYSIQGATPLDREFKRQWGDSHASINIGTNLFGSTYYLNVFDDFIVEVIIDQKLADDIERFYARHETLTPKIVAVFEKLIASKRPVRMKISKKKNKAAALRKKMSRDFYIPKGLAVD